MARNKSNQLVDCRACGTPIKERRMSHHLRHHCPGRQRRAARKSRVYRNQWGKKLPQRWDARRIIRRIVRRSSALSGTPFYVEVGARVVFRLPVVQTFRDTFARRSLSLSGW